MLKRCLKSRILFLLTLLLWVPARSYAIELSEVDFIDASDAVRSFVIESLKPIGIDKKDLVVKTGNKVQEGNTVIYVDIGWAMMPDETLMVPYSEVDHNNPLSLVRLLQKSDLSLEEREKLNRDRAIIQHEGTHLKSRDWLKKRVVAALILGGTAAVFAYTWGQIYTTPTSTGLSVLKGVSFIPSAFLSLLSALAVNASYARYTEQRADDGIADDIEVLQALEKYRRECDDENCKQTGFFVKLFNSHPSCEQRAKRLRERIAQL